MFVKCKLRTLCMFYVCLVFFFVNVKLMFTFKSTNVYSDINTIGELVEEEKYIVKIFKCHVFLAKAILLSPQERFLLGFKFFHGSFFMEDNCQKRIYYIYIYIYIYK